MPELLLVKTQNCKKGGKKVFASSFFFRLTLKLGKMYVFDVRDFLKDRFSMVKKILVRKS